MTLTARMRPSRKQVEPRRKPTQDRAIASRSKIMAGAKQLLSTKGVSDFSMRKLALTSGVGLGTIYDYFPGWTDIIRVLLEERFELRQTILASTLEDISREEGLAVFVPAYLQRLADQGFWKAYDLHLRAAAKSDAELEELHQAQEREIAERYVQEMKQAGSGWNEADLLQVAHANMEVSQLIDAGEQQDGHSRQLQIELVANMIVANLKMTLRNRPSGHREDTR